MIWIPACAGMTDEWTIYAFDKIESNRKKYIYSNIRIVSNKQYYKYCWRLEDITIFDDALIV